MAELRLPGAASIDAAALDALRRHRGPRTEPQLVAAIFRDERFRRAIIDAVEPLWRLVAVRTVFVHGRPLVSFSCAHGSCELGDALVVYRERLGVGQRRRQGVLLQAKMWRGNGRSWVETDPDQHALYRHWPAFTIQGGPTRELRLPPGDYGRVLALAEGATAVDGPRVSPRRPPEPGCTREEPCGSETLGTLGRAIRGVVRFELGERVEADWAVVIGDMIKRVGPSSPGATFPAGPRGGSTVRESGSRAASETEADDIAALDELLDHASDLPPEDEATFDREERPLSILLIDVEEVG